MRCFSGSWFFTLAAAAALAPSPAAADTRVFYTRPEWQSALGSASRTQESFNAITPFVLSSNTPTAIGAIGITHHNTTTGTAEIADGAVFGNLDGTCWFRGYTGVLPAASWTLAFPSPVTAYGADYDSPASGCGIMMVIHGQSFKFTHIGSGRGFFGVISDTTFSSVEYRRDEDSTIPAEIWALDNLAFADTAATTCIADFNRSGGVTVQDVFDFLVAYFAALPSADINGAGGVTIQDVFDYLASFFSGCP
jgi:hypothetical protein